MREHPRLQTFWRHIESNAVSLANMSSSDDESYNVALKALQTVHPNLYLVIGHAPTGRKLIITAEGDTALFSLVDEIVDAAPMIPDWKILALKPGCGFPEFARWNQVRIAIADVFFEPLELSNGGLGIRLLISEFSETIAKEARLALIQAMEFALGERMFALEVQYVELHAKDPAIDNDIPLVRLEEYIEWRRNRIENGVE